MKKQIVFPSKFDKLSQDDKKLVENLIKSILQAEEATNILLDLLGSQQLDAELAKFRENCRQHFDQNADKKLNLEVVNSSSNSAPIAALSMNNTGGGGGGAGDDISVEEILPEEFIMEFMIGRSEFFRNSAKTRCKQICQVNPSSPECQDCKSKLGIS